MKTGEIDIVLPTVTLRGELVIPENAIGIVIFSHGSGSSRLSPRNKFVAKLFEQNKIATFLFDLLTEEEDQIYETRFNIDLLSDRLIAVTQWLMKQKQASNFPLAYFGASTGAASALRASAHFGKKTKAVVSRGGRPDLALDVLSLVSSPTLLIVGGLDFAVIEMNREAYDELECIKKIEIISGATHLFEEAGKLEEVAELAILWYTKYF